MRRHRAVAKSLCSMFMAAGLTLALSVGDVALAQDADSLAKQATDELRATQQLGYRDKDAAFAKLPEIQALIEQLRTADPKHGRLRSLTGQFDRLVKDMERRTGRNYGEATPPPKAADAAKPAPAPAQPSSAATDDKLPSAAEYRLGQVERELENGEKQVQGGTPTRAARYVQNAEQKLDQVLAMDIDHSHPRIVETIRRLEALRDAVEAGQASKMPSAVKGELAAVADRLDSAESALGTGPETRQDDEESALEQVSQHLDVAERRLQGAVAESAKAGFNTANEPRFAEFDTRLSELKRRYDSRVAGLQQGQAKDAALAARAAADFQALGELAAAVKDTYVNSNTMDLSRLITTNDLTEAKARLAKLDEFDAGLRKEVEAKLAEIEATYGSDGNEIDSKLRAAGYRDTAGRTYDGLKQMLADADAFRRAAAEKLAGMALREAQSIRDGAHDFSFPENVARAQAKAALARDYADGDAKVEGMLATLQQDLDAAVAERWRRVDERTWPGHDRSAPTDKDDFAEAAQAWIANEPEWGKRSKNPHMPVKIAITGDWVVTKRDLTGRPTQYGLPVLVAVEQPNEKSDNLARVYELTMLAAERADPPLSPPFVGAWVGDSWYLRRDKLD